MEKDKRPTKILIECPQLIASVRVGVMEPLRLLEQEKCCELRYRDTKEITRGDVAWCDVLITVRGCEYPTLRIVQEARRAGRFLIYFLDDDLLNIPHGNSSTDYYSDNKIKVNLTKIISECDLLWAVNQKVIEKYQKWCGRAVLSKVPAELRREPPGTDGVFHVLYAGSVDHSGMVQEKLKPAVIKLLAELPGELDFTFIGADPEIRGLPGVCYYPFYDSYEAYQKAVLNGGFSLGLAPAYHTSFYACKYYNKFIEYTQNGIAGLYEDCEPYTQVVRDGENGFLCQGEPEDWYQRIGELLLSREKVREAAQEAGTQMRAQFSYGSIDRALREAIPELVEYRAKTIQEDAVILPNMRWLFIRERLQMLCRIYGVAAVAVIPWKAIKMIVKRIRKKLGRG